MTIYNLDTTKTRKPTVLVTGAGGFLGGTIVEALHFGDQYQVRAGLARWLSAPRVARLPITLVQCNILKPDELAMALANVDYVIHCAVGDHAVTVDGTRNLLTAAAKAKVKRLVHISTVSVYGDAPGDVVETTVAPHGTLTDYGQMKLEAERICLATDMDVVRLRPSIIYGPFAARWTMLYAQRLRAGWKHLGPLGLGKCNLIHAHDVTRFAIAALTQDGVAGDVFNVNGPEVVTWNEYFERFAQALGLPPMQPQGQRRTEISTRATGVVRSLGKYAMTHHRDALRWVAHKSDGLKQLMEQTELSMRLTTNAQELALYRLDARYLTDKANRVFGFQSSVDIDTGLRITARWLDHMGEAA